MENIRSFGVLRDIKNGEYRVVLTPAEVRVLAEDGVKVYLASDAGYKAGFDNEDYSAAGAEIAASNEAKKSGRPVILWQR